MTYEGTLSWVDIGTGFWQLESEGKKYRLVLQQELTMPTTPCEVKVEARASQPDLFFADYNGSEALYVTSLE